MSNLPNLSLENSYQGLVIGVDEVGRGCIAGPVVAAAVILDRDNIPVGINDSKKLSAKKREAIYEQIVSDHQFGVGLVEVPIIDNINILQGAKLAMVKAIEELGIQGQASVLIDGNQYLHTQYDEETVVKGDSKSLSIAAASIVAKVYRDRLMAKLAIDYPHYDWENNAGYGTKKHLQGIELHGINEHHRRSFAPIKNYVLAA